jgi:hypothetical protein
VNRNINQDVTPILYGENKLVEVQNFYGSFLETDMANHKTPFFKLDFKAKNFSKHVTKINIKRDVMKKRLTPNPETRRWPRFFCMKF